MNISVSSWEDGLIWIPHESFLTTVILRISRHLEKGVDWC